MSETPGAYPTPHLVADSNDGQLKRRRGGDSFVDSPHGCPTGFLRRHALRNKTQKNVSDRLLGLVVKAPASRAEDPGFESRLRRDIFGVESYQ